MLGVLELLLDLGLGLLATSLRVGLGVLALALDRLVGGLLRFGDPMLDLPLVLPLDLGQTHPPALADLAGVLGAVTRVLCGLDRLLLDVASVLGGLSRALHPDVDGVAAQRNGIDERRTGAATAITRLEGGGARRVSHALGRFEGSGQQPCGIGRHLPKTGLGPFR